MNVHASGMLCYAAGDDADTATQAAPADASGAKGKEGSALTEGAKEEKGGGLEKVVVEQDEMATVSCGARGGSRVQPSTFQKLWNKNLILR